MMSLIPISHYGLHTDDGIAYLHQGKTSAPNFIGLRRQSPFQSRPEGARACPHFMNISAPMPDRNHHAQFCKLFNDPLFQLMLPIPKEQFSHIPYFSDPNNDLSMTLTILGKLCSPLVNVVHPYRSLTEKEILTKLVLTNLAPLVLTGIGTEDQASVERLVKQAQLQPRQLVLTGDSTVVVRPPLRRLGTVLFEIDNHQLVQLPMEQLGVMALRRHVRREKIDAPYIGREPEFEM